MWATFRASEASWPVGGTWARDAELGFAAEETGCDRFVVLSVLPLVVEAFQGCVNVLECLATAKRLADRCCNCAETKRYATIAMATRGRILSCESNDAKYGETTQSDAEISAHLDVDWVMTPCVTQLLCGEVIPESLCDGDKGLISETINGGDGGVVRALA